MARDRSRGRGRAIMGVRVKPLGTSLGTVYCLVRRGNMVTRSKRTSPRAWDDDHLAKESLHLLCTLLEAGLALRGTRYVAELISMFR